MLELNIHNPLFHTFVGINSEGRRSYRTNTHASSTHAAVERSYLIKRGCVVDQAVAHYDIDAEIRKFFSSN